MQRTLTRRMSRFQFVFNLNSQDSQRSQNEMHECKKDDRCRRKSQRAACFILPIQDGVDEVVVVSVGSAHQRVGQAEDEPVKEAET